MNDNCIAIQAKDIHKQVCAIEKDIRDGILSFPAIARKHRVPAYFVTQVWEFVCECEMDD